MHSVPKISIVTPSFNQAGFLEETILSVLNERYANLEYIIVDGGSTDGSVEIIKKYEKYLAWWTTDRDRGQAHAINKGIERCSGEIFGFLNSDDIYLPGVFNAVVQAFSTSTSCSWIGGGWLMFGEAELYQNKNWWHMPLVPRDAAAAVYQNYVVAQPSHFWKLDAVKSTGGFDESYSYCFDHEFYIRLLLAGHQCQKLDRPISAYRLHGSSKTVTSHEWGGEPKKIFDRYADRIPKGRLRCEARRARHNQRFDECYTAFQRALDLMHAQKRCEAIRTFFAAIQRYPRGICSSAAVGCARRLIAKSHFA